MLRHDGLFPRRSTRPARPVDRTMAAIVLAGIGQTLLETSLNDVIGSPAFGCRGLALSTFEQVPPIRHENIWRGGSVLGDATARGHPIPREQTQRLQCPEGVVGTIRLFFDLDRPSP